MTSLLLVTFLVLAVACGEDEPEFCRFSSGSDVWVDSPTDQVCGSATNAVIGASLGLQ
jgi:hypothetical protein